MKPPPANMDPSPPPAPEYIPVCNKTNAPKTKKKKKKFYKVRDANHEPAKKDTSQKKKAVGR
jgi:hypothetical protein